MWTLERGPSLKRKLKKFAKKHRNEVKAVFDNLDTYIVSLNQGVKPMQLFQHRFVHNESAGVHAIDQSPLKKGALALRLYVYPDDATQTVFVLTMGDKSSQARDVQECVQAVRELRKKVAKQFKGMPKILEALITIPIWNRIHELRGALRWMQRKFRCHEQLFGWCGW